MAIEIVSESPAQLTEYARVPSAFLVTEFLDDTALQAMSKGTDCSPTRVATPYWKDYDAYPGNAPADWPTRFEVSSWQIFAAYRSGQRVGGAVLIAGDAQVELRDGRADLALLWDLRVAPDARRQGVGRALLDRVSAAARRAGCTALRVETQNVNVPACRFYRASGFTLEAVRAHAYPDLPDERQLLWNRSLTESATG